MAHAQIQEFSTKVGGGGSRAQMTKILLTPSNLLQRGSY